MYSVISFVNSLNESQTPPRGMGEEDGCILRLKKKGGGEKGDGVMCGVGVGRMGGGNGGGWWGLDTNIGPTLFQKKKKKKVKKKKRRKKSRLTD